MEFVRGLNLLCYGYCIARNHDDKIWKGQRAVLFAAHMGSRRSTFITKSQLGSWHCLFTEDGRCSVRAGMMVEERTGWRYLHKGCNCDLLCKESRVKHLCLEHKPKTPAFSFIQLKYTVHHWMRAQAIRFYYHAKRIIFSFECIQCKRSAYEYIFQGKSWM